MHLFSLNVFVCLFVCFRLCLGICVSTAHKCWWAGVNSKSGEVLDRIHPSPFEFTWKAKVLLSTQVINSNNTTTTKTGTLIQLSSFYKKLTSKKKWIHKHVKPKRKKKERERKHKMIYRWLMRPILISRCLSFQFYWGRGGRLESRGWASL